MENLQFSFVISGNVFQLMSAQWKYFFVESLVFSEFYLINLRHLTK